jgi:hypothetical protein
MSDLPFATVAIAAPTILRARIIAALNLTEVKVGMSLRRTSLAHGPGMLFEGITLRHQSFQHRFKCFSPLAGRALL